MDKIEEWTEEKKMKVKIAKFLAQVLQAIPSDYLTTLKLLSPRHRNAYEGINQNPT